MRIINKTTNEIVDLKNWPRPKSPEKHWKDGRNAKEFTRHRNRMWACAPTNRQCFIGHVGHIEVLEPSQLRERIGAAAKSSFKKIPKVRVYGVSFKNKILARDAMSENPLA